MSERLDEFDPGTEVVLVTFTDAESLVDYRRRNDVRYRVLIDPDRAAYVAFGFGRGSVGRVWGRRALGRYVELYRRARRDGVSFRLKRPTEDTLQLGGDVVIGPDGRLAWIFRGAGPDDRPPVDDLVAAAAAAGR